MLWIVGAILFVVWLVGTFLLHKGGPIHFALVFAICFFVVQFTQDRRTKEYKRSLKR
jgi:Flp pilus assembly protein TadB